MKKSALFAALVFVAAIFVGCQGGLTPETSTVKLFPAGNADGSFIGFIDNKGKMVIPAQFNSCNRFSCGYARVTMSNRIYFVDTKGTIQNRVPMLDNCGSFYYNASNYLVNNLWGMMDTNFETLIQPAYNSLGRMSDVGLARVRPTAGDKYGYLNKEGRIIVAPQFDEAYSFSDGLAIVRVGDKYGAIDKSGNFAINAVWDDLSECGEGRMVFYDATAKKCGLIDLNGVVKLPAMYDAIGAAGDNGLIWYQQDNRFGYIDKNGNIVLAPMFDYATPFADGIAWVIRAGGNLVEAINKKGETMFMLLANETPQELFHNGLAAVLQNADNGALYKYVDQKGTMVYYWTKGGSQINNAPARNRFTERVNPNYFLLGTQYGYRVADRFEDFMVAE